MTAEQRREPRTAAGRALTYEEFRKEIQDALDRDGQLDWDETARLAEIVAAKLWNQALVGIGPAPLIEAEASREAEGLDVDGIVAELMGVEAHLDEARERLIKANATLAALARLAAREKEERS